jgi:4-amino-4-deoxy-L-arabinose transferase-like glycosyltransferase
MPPIADVGSEAKTSRLPVEQKSSGTSVDSPVYGVADLHENRPGLRVSAGAVTRVQAWSATDSAILTGLIVGAVLLPALLQVGSHSFGLPWNDDWSFRRTAVQFAQTGHLSFNGWTPPLFGEALWAWPFLKVFGYHGWVLSATTAILGIVGIGCAYYLARQVLPRLRAALAVLLVVAIPGFALSTVSFMTDIPAFAAALACLTLGLLATRHEGSRHWALFIASMVVGIWAFSIRDFALAAPISVLLWTARGAKPGRRAPYIAIGVVTLLACALAYAWALTLPQQISSSLSSPDLATVERTGQAYFTLAFMLSPVLATTTCWKMVAGRQRWLPVLIGAVVFALGIILYRQEGQIFVGNYISPSGVLEGGRAAVLPTRLWHLFILVALCSGAALAAAMTAAVLQPRRRPRLGWRPVGLLKVYTAVLAIGLTVYGLTGPDFFDRYLWPLAFTSAILLLSNGRASSPVRTGQGWLLLGFVIVGLSARAVWFTSLQSALGAGVLLAAAFAMSSQARTSSSSLARVLRFVCVLAAGAFALYCLSGTSHLDRFVWPVTLVVGLLLFAFYLFEGRKLPTRQPSLWSQHANLGGAVLWVCLAVTAIALSVNSATYYAALWRGGQMAVSRGVSAATVDAGFDWVGTYASSPADPARGKGYASGYPHYFASFRQCAVVSDSRFVGTRLRLIGTVSYESLGIARRQTLFVYRAPSC